MGLSVYFHSLLLDAIGYQSLGFACLAVASSWPLWRVKLVYCISLPVNHDAKYLCILTYSAGISWKSKVLLARKIVDQSYPVTISITVRGEARNIILINTESLQSLHYDFTKCSVPGYLFLPIVQLHIQLDHTTSVSQNPIEEWPSKSAAPLSAWGKWCRQWKSENV